MPVRSRYSTVAIVLHWTIALLIIANLAIGWRMGFLKGLAQFEIFQLHKSVGITVLLLSILRLGWRLTHSPPPLPTGMAAWERLAAQVTHWAFYALMIALPLTGWIMVSVSPYNIPTLLWKTVPWPHIGFLHDLSVAQKTAVDGAGGTAHMVMAFGCAALIALHVAAALKHQFLSRDDLLSRMIPGRATTPHVKG
ncbi:MAG TPA: cytochrome b [Sphingobium sp.]